MWSIKITKIWKHLLPIRLRYTSWYPHQKGNRYPHHTWIPFRKFIKKYPYLFWLRWIVTEFGFQVKWAMSVLIAYLNQGWYYRGNTFDSSRIHIRGKNIVFNMNLGLKWRVLWKWVDMQKDQYFCNIGYIKWNYS